MVKHGVRRMTLNLEGFNPESYNPDVLAKVATKVDPDNQPGWRLSHIDENGKPVVERYDRVTSVIAQGGRSKELRLSDDTTPASAKGLAARLAGNGDGYLLTFFDAHNKRATITQLTPEEDRVRTAISELLRVDPWAVQITARDDGGFDLQLPPKYNEARHLDQLHTIAETIAGEPGWYARIDPRTLTGSLIPAELPTFPATIPYPLEQITQADRDKTIFAHGLPPAGEDLGEPVAIDFGAQAFGMLAGIPESGKTVTINAIVAGQLAGGAELAIIDVPHKRVDFTWCQDFCRPGGWGADSLAQSVTALSMLYAEGQRRAEVLHAHNVQNWKQLPAEVRFTPIFIVVDELAAMLSKKAKPPKSSPRYVEWELDTMLRAEVDYLIEGILAEHRFVGFRMLLSSQVTNNTTGLGPSKKSKMGHFFLQGVSTSRSARTQAFNDPEAVPPIPKNILSDAAAGRGVGVADLAGGGGPKIFKTLFAHPNEYREALLSMGLERRADFAPTDAQMAQHTPTLDGDAENDQDDVERGPSGRPAAEIAAAMGDDLSWQYDDSGKKLTGYAKANAARKASAEGGQPN